MNRYPSPWARGVAATLAVLMGLTAAPPLAAAGTPEAPRPTTLAAAAATRVAASASQAVAIAPTQDAGGVAGESKPFFKTGKGIAALVLMVGATAWVIASRKSDSVVHSPGRQ